MSKHSVFHNACENWDLVGILVPLGVIKTAHPASREPSHAVGFFLKQKAKSARSGFTTSDTAFDEPTTFAVTYSGDA